MVRRGLSAESCCMRYIGLRHTSSMLLTCVEVGWHAFKTHPAGLSDMLRGIVSREGHAMRVR